MGHIPPLSALGWSVRLPSQRERFWSKIPIVGLLVEAPLSGRRFEESGEMIRSQLVTRGGDFNPTVWGGTSRRQELARHVCQSLAKAIGWPHANFLPEDPFVMLCWPHQDGLDDLDFKFRLEGYLKRDISREEFDSFLDMSLGQVVDRLLEKAL